MKSIERLHALGQSIWYDNIERRLLRDGTLAGLIEHGEIRGVTSNPSIFNKAIASSSDYDAALQPMAWAGWGAERIFFQLAVEDIQNTADLFLPLYQKSHGGDGYVSLEVNPRLAHDTRGTVAQAKQLWAQVDRPNLMIKIPATKAGIPAIRQCIAAGLNINVTLIFSLERYQAVMEAYLSGLEDRLKKGKSIEEITSVASFFVSRVDTKIDPRLTELMKEPAKKSQAESLLGKAAIANARVAYARYKEIFNSPRFLLLKVEGARVQRPLWASTSTKNPAYRDVIYVEQLIGPETVNTIPPQTLDAFREHGKAARTLDKGLIEARADLLALEKLGIHMDQVTAELETEGVEAFAKAFTELLASIESRAADFREELGSLAAPVGKRMALLEKQKVTGRIWKHDASVWAKDRAGVKLIRERLGWLNAPAAASGMIPELEKFRAACLKAGFTHVLLLGMGGSSLAPEVMRDIFSAELSRSRGLKFIILDSTDPGQVRMAARWAPVGKTLYIVASKSGGTSEVDAMFRFFWEREEASAGRKTGAAFIAITDPGTSLEKLAKDKHFQRTFLAEKTVGGRYSALTPFGLVPAALMGIDLAGLLGAAVLMQKACGIGQASGANPGLALGVLIGEASLKGREKLTVITDDLFKPFGPWLEQLVAESSGKQGKGILPVVQEPSTKPAKYGHDRLFIYIRSDGRAAGQVEGLRKAGHPVVTLAARAPVDLGAEFFRWGFATAVACSVLGVNAFDQPDVQDNKDRTKAKLGEFWQRGSLQDGKALWENDRFAVYGKIKGDAAGCKTLADVLKLFAADTRPGDYLALNAYLPRDDEKLAALQEMRNSLLNFRGHATTLGFGPRFLHSTGQYHKGGRNNGIFFQITADPEKDIAIPGQPFSFAVLERAQALGDLEALQVRKRRVIRIHLKQADLKSLGDIFKKVFRKPG
jgi:transaldolase/glucose-6-phosphate isomerase